MSEGVSVVTWKWGTQFGPEYVNRLSSMLKRHLHMPFRFHVITDNPIGIDEDICQHPIFHKHENMKAGNRSCFRRLQIFSRDMLEPFGSRILQLDLDMVITADVTSLFDRPDPLVLVEQNRHQRRVTYNPSMLLMDTGILHDMWERFDRLPNETWQTAKSHGWNCSDMSVINDYLDQHQAIPRATWRLDEGVISYWREVKRDGKGDLPAGARVVLFYGHQNPSDAPIQAKSPWILEHWL